MAAPVFGYRMLRWSLVDGKRTGRQHSMLPPFSGAEGEKEFLFAKTNLLPCLKKL